jgi:hypothetical protein
MLNPAGNEPHKVRREEYDAARDTMEDEEYNLQEIEKALKNHGKTGKALGETPAWHAYHDELVAMKTAAESKYDAAQAIVENYGGR